MTGMDAETRKVVAELVGRIRAIETGGKQQARGSQAAYRSLEAAEAPVLMYDAEGVLRGRMGVQPDGTFTRADIGGDPPAVPSAPVVESSKGALVITWDGYDENDEAGWPATLLGVRVHLSTAQGFDVAADDPVARIGPEGGTITYALPGTTAYYVKLVAITTSGVTSAASAEAEGVPAAVGAGGYYAPTEPLGLGPDDVDAAWYDTSDGNRHHRWDGTDWVPVDIGPGTMRVAGDLVVDMTLRGGKIIASDPAGASRIEIGSYPNVFESGQDWNQINLFATDPSFDPGQVWASTDSSTGDSVLHLNAPRPQGGTQTAALRLYTSTGGVRRMQWDANAIEWTVQAGANAADINLFGSNIFRVRGPGKDYFDVRFDDIGGVVIQSRDQQFARKNLIVRAQDIFIDAGGAADMQIGASGSTVGWAIKDPGRGQFGVALVSGGGGENKNPGGDSGTLRVMDVFGNGYKSMWAADFLVSSDERYKFDQQPVTDDWALQVSRELDVLSYQRDPAGGDTRRDYGVSAQQLARVMPDAVTADDSGSLVVSATDLLALVLALAKNADTRLIALESRA